MSRGPFDGQAAQSAERAVTTPPAGYFRQQLAVRLASLPWLLLCVVVLADIAWKPLALGVVLTLAACAGALLLALLCL